MECLLLLFLVGVGSVASEISLRFVFIIESQEGELPGTVGRVLQVLQQHYTDVVLDEEVVLLDRQHEDASYRMLCAAVSKGVSAIIDVSWSPWQQLEELATQSATVVVRAWLGPQQLVGAVDDYLEGRNATDAAILVQTEAEVDQTLYQLLGGSNLRVWVGAGLTRDSARALAAMRPEPHYIVLLGTMDFVRDTYNRAVKEKLVRHANRWTLVITDVQQAQQLDYLVLPAVVLHAQLDCCKLTRDREPCSCSWEQRPQQLLTAILQHLVDIYSRMEDTELTARVDCEEVTSHLNGTRRKVEEMLAEEGASNDTLFYWDSGRSLLQVRSHFTVSSQGPGGGPQPVYRWSVGEQPGLVSTAAVEPTVRLFFRVGTAEAVPWTMKKRDPHTGDVMLDERGQPLLEGYCIDLIARLAETMDFDYEIVLPTHGTFGNKQANGTWDGVVGDLMRGETDMAVGALTMTAEREEVIDFVPPYFEQTGILIVIRKPGRKTSLFKFMTVLRGEVWASVVCALALTGTMIWLLDKYSPYSARNNKQAYPYPCREFTLKESFWFALTSFTPQGGGEAPKALSGRTLVAAYWLFVVLMLATFTANLAAFLTVERMQSPVSSLEQLARQSRINYTVVEGSSIHQYFINMKFAEDTLYRVWKEITLNATSDQAQYRVWDYPIREQYGHILLAINASGPVPDARTGFNQVNEHTDADFAFIHDSAEIRYEITRNCNLTEVGEQFAEQPYALAVQQGSRLQARLSRALLDLQKERLLEHLAHQYWNETARQSCPDADESEGITLESLGGVFIATLFGLGLAMLTLAWEVFYYKRKEKSKLQPIDKPFKSDVESKMAAGVTKLKKRIKGGKVKKVTIGDNFKPVDSKVSYISVYPKREYQP